MNRYFLTFLFILILIIVIALFIYFKYRKPKTSCIIAYSGKLGGGKSFNGSADAVKFLRIARRRWKRVNKPFLLAPLYKIPYFNKKRLNNELYGLECPNLYSNFPIIISKNELSLSITNDIMFLRESIPLNSIVIIDEFSSWISQFEFNEVFSDTLNDHIQKFRHYHGNLSHLIILDQCSNNIPIQIRYRLNQVCCCISTSHYFKFFHITKYKYIDLTDDIKSVELIDNDNSDTEDKVLKMFRISGRIYDDRAWSNRYYYVDGNDKHTKFIDSKLKVDLPLRKPMPNEKYPNLDIAIIQANKDKIKSNENS